MSKVNVGLIELGQMGKIHLHNSLHPKNAGLPVALMNFEEIMCLGNAGTEIVATG